MAHLCSPTGRPLAPDAAQQDWGKQEAKSRRAETKATLRAEGPRGPCAGLARGCVLPVGATGQLLMELCTPGTFLWSCVERLGPRQLCGLGPA